MSRFDLERETRKLLREEIRRSPAILKEYRRRHWWDWLWYLGVCLLTPALALTGLTMMPLSFTIPLHLPLILGFLDLSNVSFPLTPDSAPLLCGQAMLVAAIGSAALMHGWACFCPQKNLFAATFWPISDKELNWRSHKSWLWNLFYLCYVLALLTMSVAIAAHPSPLQLAALILAIPLNAWHLMALVILWCSAISTSQRANTHWACLALLLLSMIWVAGMASVLPWTPIVGISETALSIPTGWVNATIRHLFFEPHPLVIGYIAALAATWIYAANWLRKGFRIRELYLAANGKVTPVFESGLLTPTEALASLPASVASLRTNSETLQPSELRQPPTPESIQEKLRSLLGNSWDGCSLLERLISGRMTRRQTTLLEYVYRGHPRWTLAALISTALTFAGVLITAAGYYLAVWLGHRPDQAIAAPMGFMFWLLMTLLVETIVNQRDIQTRQISNYNGLHPVYPVGIKDLMATQRRMVFGRLPLWLVQLLAIASLDWLFSPEWVGLSYLWTCEFALLFALILDTFGWLIFSTSVPSSFSWCRVGALAGMTALTCLWLCAAALACIPLVYVAIPAVVVALLCGLGIRTYGCWVYRTAIDYECRETVLTKGR